MYRLWLRDSYAQIDRDQHTKSVRSCMLFNTIIEKSVSNWIAKRQQIIGNKLENYILYS